MKPYEERLWVRNDDGDIIGEIVGGCLVIKARRHGRKTTTVIPLTELMKMAGWTCVDGRWVEGGASEVTQVGR